jgi:FAD/FMN-containing dehydrogenase
MIAEPSALLRYTQEPRGLFEGKALAVVRPSNALQVARVVAVCNDEGLGVVPQGGNTGLVGGQTPCGSRPQIILSLQKLDRIREVDSQSDAMTLEAGVTLLGAQEAAAAADRYFPLSLAAEGSCTIGGNLATNAGGVHVIAYGSARDLTLGVEAVMADGRVLSSLSKLRKDNTGYDLTRLLVGSEGTLGVITAATVKLFARPRARATAFVGLADVRAALDLLNFLKAEMGAGLVAFELISRLGLEFSLRHVEGAREPLQQSWAWYALVEFVSPQEQGLDDVVVDRLHGAYSLSLCGDAAVASSLRQAQAFWRLREELPQAQKREGASIKHDVSVPLAEVPAFIDEASTLVLARIPGARLVPFGHMGDGNIHFNISQPLGADGAAFLARWDEVNRIVHGVVRKLGGSISAEHGIGQLKRGLLREVKDPVALDVMRRIKASLDPKDTLNPGKLL